MPGKFLFKMALWFLLFVIALALILTAALPGFSKAFFTNVSGTMETWIVIGACILLGIYMMKSDRR